MTQVFQGDNRKPNNTTQYRDFMFFRKKETNAPLCAFGFHTDGVSFARVKENRGKLSVEVLEYHKGNKTNSLSTLKNIAKLHKLKKAPCATYLTHQDYQLVVTEAPEVPKEDMVSALTWIVKDLIDFPIENATLDVFAVPEETSTKKNINVVAAFRSKIEGINNLFKEARLQLNIIDIEEMALRNLVTFCQPEQQGTVVLWLAKEYGKILFIKNGNIYLARNIEMGSDYLKSNYNAMDTIALEVQRSVDYFERHFSHVSMQHLLFMPSEGNADTFIEFLNKNLTIQASTFGFDNILDGLENYDPLMIAKMLITLGTALRCEKADLNK